MVLFGYKETTRCSLLKIYAKLEGFNPGGSVKDRPAWRMVQEGLRSGKLQPGKTILDSTSGNTGIALALVGSVLRYPVELVLPANVSAERKRIIGAYGAKAIYSDPLEGSDGAIRMCRKILEADPEKYFKPDQYFNPMNPQAHYENTGPEIYRQTNGTITHFVAGIGTGGTIMGTGRYLKEVNPRIQVIAVEPDDALHGLEGLKHMATAVRPGIFDPSLVDATLEVATEDALSMTSRLAQDENLVVGPSSGANVFAARRVALSLDQPAVVVTILCDRGERYW